MVILSTMLRELIKRKAPGLRIYEYFCVHKVKKICAAYLARKIFFYFFAKKVVAKWTTH